MGRQAPNSHRAKMWSWYKFNHIRVITQIEYWNIFIQICSHLGLVRHLFEKRNVSYHVTVDFRNPVQLNIKLGCKLVLFLLPYQHPVSNCDICRCCTSPCVSIFVALFSLCHFVVCHLGTNFCLQYRLSGWLSIMVSSTVQLSRLPAATWEWCIGGGCHFPP